MSVVDRRGFLGVAVAGGAVGTAASQGRVIASAIEKPDAVTPEMFGARRDDPSFDSGDAISSAFTSGSSVRFGRGTYYVGRSVAPGHTNARAHFDNTTIRIKRAAVYESFTECLGWDGLPLRGRRARGNLPAIETGVRVLFDLTGSRYSYYTGQLELRGEPSFDGLAILGSSNHRRIPGGQAGGGGSVWDCNLVLSFGTFGMFGTPRFDAPSNEFYPDPFAGSVFERIRIHSCRMPLLAGANTLDDSFINVLHLALRDGDKGYLYTTALNAGSVFMRCNGKAATAVALDVQESTISANTFYAENSFDAPIVLRYGAWINGVLRHGAGRNSKFSKGCMVYAEASEAGGTVTAHERCRDSRHMEALVKLHVDSPRDSRTFVVHQPYPETEKAAFAFDHRDGAPAYTQDSLVCLAPGGPIRFKYQNGTLLRYQRHAGGGPYEPLTGGPDRQSLLPSYEASYGTIIVATADPATQTLFVHYGALRDTGYPVVYTDFRIDAGHPHRLLLTAPNKSDLGRQITISARSAAVTLVCDANCRLAGDSDRILTRDGNERILLLGTEYWAGSSHQYGWVQIGT